MKTAVKISVFVVHFEEGIAFWGTMPTKLKPIADELGTSNEKNREALAWHIVLEFRFRIAERN